MNLETQLSQQRAVSEQLRETLQSVEQITDNISEVFWLTDVAKTKMFFISRGYEQIWGRSREELQHHPSLWTECIHPADRDEVLRRVYTDQAPGAYDVEYRIIRPDGAVRWIHDRAFPVRDERSEVYRIAGIAEDITVRKRAEFLLEVQRRVASTLSLTADLKPALEHLLDNLRTLEGIDSGGVYLLDPTTGGLDLACWRGLSPEFIARVSHFDADSPQRRLIDGHKPVFWPEDGTYEDDAIKEEGLRSLAVFPLVHQGVAVGALNSASHEVTAIPGFIRSGLEVIAAQASGAIVRIRAAERLRESEARLRALITGAPVILFAADADGVLTFEAGKALEAFGIRPGAHVGCKVAEVFQQYPMLVESIQRVLGGEAFSSSIEINGVALDCHYAPTRDEAGAVTGLIGVATDVTERRLLERQILEIADREQARIGQEIHDGLSQQLVGLAFDVNGLHERLRSERHSQAQHARRVAQYLDEAITEARHLARGLFPIQLHGLGLCNALEDLARTTSERFKLKCTFDSNYQDAPQDPSVATHLYRIAQEAVNNAVKHSRGKTILITLRRAPGEVMLTVQDNGSGMPAKKSDAASGGMGLQIMAYRARSVGGTVRLEGAPGGGTLLECRVPFRGHTP